MNIFIMQNSIVRPLGRDMQNVLIGFVGEHEARTFFVRTRDDLTGYTVGLVIDDVDCGAMTKAPMPDGSIMLSLTLTSDMLGKGGDKVCQLLMTKDAIVRKSSQFRAYVGASNDINSTAPDSATIIIISEKITELVHEAALDAIAEVQEVIDSIPADYSELSARVGANTIALAEKADRSTTYTKTEVDALIDEVEVETDATLAVSGAPADAAETGRQIGLIKAELNNMSIEGYEKYNMPINGTLHTGTLISSTGNLVANSSWDCMEVECEEGETYYVTGTGNPLFITKDENGVIKSQYNPGPFVNVSNYFVTIPKDAVKLFVNRTHAEPLIYLYKNTSFVKTKASIARLVADGTYDVVGTDYVQTVQLNGSQNGLFNFSALKYQGNEFKTVTDDISPVLTDAGYIGANHGYNYAYLCTASGHGLTEQDIGYSFESEGNTFILLKINSVNQFTVICYDNTVWYRMKNIQPPSNMTFNGKEITATASSLVQLRPLIKNGVCKVIVDSDSRFAIEETYDIIDAGVGIDAVIANKGNNDNDSIVLLSDSLITVRNIFEFDDAGNVVIYANLKINKNSVRVDHYYGTQSGAFDGNRDCIAVEGTTYNKLNSVARSLYNDVWDDANIAPSLYFKTNEAKTKGMIIFYGLNRLSDIGNYAGNVNGTSGKLYPILCNIRTNNLANKVYSNYILRMPVVVDSHNDFIKSVKVNNSLFLFAYLSSAKTVSVDIPSEFYGSTANEVVSDDCVCLTKITVNQVDIQSADEGMILIRLELI